MLYDKNNKIENDMNLLSLIKKVIINSGLYIPNHSKLSYSQLGEDMILNFLFNEKSVSRINYLDIGSNDPMINSNTYFFYSSGNRGVCVEADSGIIENFKKKRPEDVLLNLGVSASEISEADFYVFDINAWNTFDTNEVKIRLLTGASRVVEVKKVKMVHINDLIERYFESLPHLLSIDIEGLDFEVLSSLDFEKYPIPVICAETCSLSSNHIRVKDEKIMKLLLLNNYEVYADTNVNTIFVHKPWFHSS